MNLVLLTLSLTHFGVQFDHLRAIVSQTHSFSHHKGGERPQLGSQFMRFQEVQTRHDSTQLNSAQQLSGGREEGRKALCSTGEVYCVLLANWNPVVHEAASIALERRRNYNKLLSLIPVTINWYVCNWAYISRVRAQ